MGGFCECLGFFQKSRVGGKVIMLDTALGIYHGHENVPQISVYEVHD